MGEKNNFLKNIIKNVRDKNPLIHNITNYVTVNDCANILLACGASPIMADDINEMEDISSICGGLNINIGTLNIRVTESMLAAGKEANKLGHPVILDPVGIGASKLRNEVVKLLLENIKFSVIRGNISEINALALGKMGTKGVDAKIEDGVTEENLNEVIEKIKKFSKELGAIIAVTGAIDIVTDGEKTYIIRNGEAMMSKVTGTGCMLSALITAFIVANSENKLEGVAGAVCAMGLSGERAKRRLGSYDGNSTYRNQIIDEIFNMTDEVLEEGAKYEVK